MLHIRFINLGMEMSEVHFVHVSKEIVGMSFQHHLLASLSFLQMNSAVNRKKQPVEPVEEQPVDPAVAVSISVDNSSKMLPPKKKKCKRKCSKCAATEPVQLEVVVEKRTAEVATQTIETSFREEQLHASIKYLMNTIQPEDFEFDD